MRVTQHFHHPTQADFDRLAHWIVIFPAGILSLGWPDLPYREVLQQRYRRRFADRAGEEPLLLELPNSAGSQVALALLDSRATAFQHLTWGRKLYAELQETAPQEIGLYLCGFTPPDQAVLTERLLTAALAGAASLSEWKSDKKDRPGLAHIECFGMAAKRDFSATLAMDAGNVLARELSRLPANLLTPALYRTRLETLAAEMGWEMRFHDLDALRALGAGAFLAVARGSGESGAGIAHLRYLPPSTGSGDGAAGKKLALVGKGVCFDTGGHQLKSAKGMQDMHEDMQGSAVALGVLLALSRLRVDFQIDCWLALAQNHLSPHAYMPSEVVTAANGTTIEIIHTDAEGRMILADTLVLASRERPDLLVDYATLTGSCVTALGSRYSGAFCNRPQWLGRLIQAGQDSGERVWPFPLDEDYDEELDSEVADIKQCILESEADHILAARFLNRFVGDNLPWLHLDLSSSHHDDGLGHIPTHTTGFGVRFTVYWLQAENWL